MTKELMMVLAVIFLMLFISLFAGNAAPIVVAGVMGFWLGRRWS